MDIIFKTEKLRKQCNDLKKRIKCYGPERSKLIGRRLDEMRAAGRLSDLHFLPPIRCHELKMDRAGQISVDLDHPYRLLFRPADNPVPLKPDGGLDWMKVTQIEILGVEDTHE